MADPRHVIRYGRPIPQNIVAETTESARTWFDLFADTTFHHLEWDKFAWPGGYQIHYITEDGGILCYDCANVEIMRTIDPDDAQFYIVDSDVLWEGPSLICDHCYREIKSEYGDPDAASDNA